MPPKPQRFDLWVGSLPRAPQTGSVMDQKPEAGSDLGHADPVGKLSFKVLQGLNYDGSKECRVRGRIVRCNGV